ncbi:MAG: hypothetical protein HZA01_07830 [Nitrospinae bacterium]|nr:hypothetical protein [Nitrospinota bacterium]
MNQKNEVKIKALEKEVFRPEIMIESPVKDSVADHIIQEVSGVVRGHFPDGYQVVAGHRETSEQSIKIHIDRRGEVLSDKTFKISDIYLGSPDKGRGGTFEIFVLLMKQADVDALGLKDGDNPFPYIPQHIAKAVTIVRRRN